MTKSGDHLQWGPILRRNLLEEENQFVSLLQILSQVHISDMGVASRVWRASQDGVLSVSSFFSVLESSSPFPSPLGRISKLKASPRVVAFGWIALRGGILTMDNLCRRKKIIVNACLMCLEDGNFLTN